MTPIASRLFLRIGPFLFAGLVLSALLITGCEEEDDWDHTPAAGSGALIIDNNTPDEISVFIDGVGTNEVDDWDWKAYDLKPGLHRVVLDQEDGDRSFADDVDILQAHLTVFDVRINSTDLRSYNVVVTFED